MAEPDTLLQIVDAHHHLWDLQAVDYPWLRERGVPRFFGDPTPIQCDYRVPEFRQDHGRFHVSKSVHVQVGTAAGEELAETRWLDQCAEQSGLPSAIVGFCDMSSDKARCTMEHHLQVSPRVRGMRHIISRHHSEDQRNGSPALLSNPCVRANLRTLSSLDLSFDLQLTPPHMQAAAELLGQTPELRVALCHAGSPWRRERSKLTEWRSGLAALAALPKTTCKLSGLGMFDRDWTRESLAPIVGTVLEVFGPKRVMWGSNFPVDKLYRSYEESLSALLTIVPTSMHEQVFRSTAERFYRI